MYSTMRSSGQSSACLFFVIWVLIGKFTLLSLFLAVIMEAFEVAHERQLHEKTASNAKALLGVGVAARPEGTCPRSTILVVVFKYVLSQRLPADHTTRKNSCTATQLGNVHLGVGTLV